MKMKKILNAYLPHPFGLRIRIYNINISMILITAMSQISKQIPEVMLLIGGKRKLENYLPMLVNQLSLDSNIHFLRIIPACKLPRHYQAADVFVLPIWGLEGFGLVIIKALSCGIPVIATPVGANPMVLGPFAEEFLCRVASPEALAERIVCFIKEGMKRPRKMYREYYEMNFRIDKNVGEVERILQSSAEVKTDG